MEKKTWFSRRILGFIYLLILSFALVSWSHFQSTELILASPPQSAPQPLPTSIYQGDKIVLNGNEFPAAWTQWQEGEVLHTGISDTGAMLYLGLELLSNKNPQVQPVRWFSSLRSRPLLMPARLIDAYRYLDVTQLLTDTDARLETAQGELKITIPIAHIDKVTPRNRLFGLRWEVNLDRSTFWQLEQRHDAEGNKELVVKVLATVAPAVLEDFSLPAQESASLPTTYITREASQTNIIIKIPAGRDVRVWTLPHRLLIDMREDTLIGKDIAWTDGITWHQRLRRAGDELFRVVWLEVAPQSPNLYIKPITQNLEGQKTTKPLLSTGKGLQAYGAINGGFFNRNNRLPLGAVRRDGIWFSGPILQRGVIAWNQQYARFDRLSLQETIFTSTGASYQLIALNSGYVKAGISRYTPEWGATYTTLVDNETIVVVQNNYVIQQLSMGKAGEDTVAIPPDGYILTLRAFNSAAVEFPVATLLNLQSSTTPADLTNYPQIMGGGPLLVQSYRLVLDGEGEQFSAAFNRQAASRSAIGVTRQGTLIFATIHNRLGGRGATLQETAQLMLRLGSVHALNLDGGSSTSLYLGGQIIDRPANTAARVSNGIGIFPAATAQETSNG